VAGRQDARIAAHAAVGGHPRAKTEKEVLAALGAYKQALINRDAAELLKVLSDDLTTISPTLTPRSSMRTRPPC
jgi:hypothetical protein